MIAPLQIQGGRDIQSSVQLRISTHYGMQWLYLVLLALSLGFTGCKVLQ